MRILLYTYDWMPLVGGIQTITMFLAKGLAEWPQTHPNEAIEVTLVTETPAGAMDDSILPFRVVRQPSIGDLIRLVRVANIVHVAGPAFLPMILGLAFRRPTVVEHHGYQSCCPNGILFFWPDQNPCPEHFMARHYGKCIRCNSGSSGWVKSFLSMMLTFPRRWLASRVNANIVPSGHIGHRISLPQTELIYHGVPRPAAPIPLEASENRGQPPCFAYVGRIIKEKGLQILLHASHGLAKDGYDFRLKIVGDGPERCEMERLTEELKLENRTEFISPVSPDRVRDTLIGVTAVTMPSFCEEVAPLVAIEQMMQGRVIIASDIGGLGEEVDGAGLTFPAGDGHALEACMKQVLMNPRLAREMGRRAERRASEVFSEERMIQQHLRLYQALISSRTRQLPPYKKVHAL